MLEIDLELNVAYSVFRIFDLILRSALVGFSLLCASDYYDIKGRVCYVLFFYNQYSYGELSILVLFLLSQDTPA